jgi:hypothetical protein
METFLDLCYNCFKLGIEADRKCEISDSEKNYFNFIQWARQSNVKCTDNECIITGSQLKEKFDLSLKDNYAIGMKHIIANSTFSSVEILSYSLEEKNKIVNFSIKFRKD